MYFGAKDMGDLLASHHHRAGGGSLGTSPRTRGYEPADTEGNWASESHSTKLLPSQRETVQRFKLCDDFRFQ